MLLMINNDKYKNMIITGAHFLAHGGYEDRDMYKFRNPFRLPVMRPQIHRYHTNTNTLTLKRHPRSRLLH